MNPFTRSLDLHHSLERDEARYHRLLQDLDDLRMEFQATPLIEQSIRQLIWEDMDAVQKSVDVLRMKINQHRVHGN
jgi:hypothetical protein